MLTKVVRQIQMRQDVDPYDLVQPAALDAQECARSCCTRVGDQQAHVKILGSLLHLLQEALQALVHPNGPIVHPVFVCKLAAHIF